MKMASWRRSVYETQLAMKAYRNINGGWLEENGDAENKERQRGSETTKTRHGKSRENGGK
jgi:hypothetical protein